MGMCFFFGGINRMEQHFNVVVAQTAASLLALAVSSLIIPTAFKSWSEGMSCPSPIITHYPSPLLSLQIRTTQLINPIQPNQATKTKSLPSPEEPVFSS
jgi:Ca2+/H+ antiporter